MKLQDLLTVLPKKAIIRVVKTGYPMLYQGTITFSPKDIGKEQVDYVSFVAYKFRKKGTRYRVRWERELIPMPYWLISVISDRQPLPSKEELKVLTTPPSQQNPADIYGEVGAEYFDDEDK